MTICERCGATTTDDSALFCGICGAPLPKPATSKGVIKPGPRAGAPRSKAGVDAKPRGTIPEAPISAALKPIGADPSPPHGAIEGEPPNVARPAEGPIAPPLEPAKNAGEGAPIAQGEKPFKPPKHLPAGALVDKKYAVLRVLGEGGMGVVYLARDIHTGLDVVVKAVRSELAHRDDVRARTLAEGRALAQIDHPNVVHLRAVALEGVSLFLVMQYIDGESLDKIIHRYTDRGDKMPVEEALGVFRQIAAGVGAAHQEGVVHRDLKPANVLVRRKDRVAKVTDFGIALMPTERDRPHTRGILGSLWYMSPEQVTGRRDLDLRVDIYALGILLYQMLVGRVPFDAKSDYEIMKLHAEAPMPLIATSRPDVPRAIDEIVQRACAKDREQRFASCDELIAAVDRALGAGLPAAPSVTTSGAALATSADGATPAPPRDDAEARAGLGAPSTSPKIAATGSMPGDAPIAAAVAPKRQRRVWPWVAFATLLLGAGGAGAAAGFGLVPGVKGIWKLPELGAAPRAPASAPRGSATATRTAGVSTAARATSSLESLAGAWVGNGRELEAVMVGSDLEFRVKKIEHFAAQGYEVGEARFVLRSTSEPSVYAVEDRIRPVPPVGKTYDPRARGTCQEVWTAVAGEPLRAREGGGRLSVEFAKIEPLPANFTSEGARVTSCVGLRDVKASKVVSLLVRP